MGESAIAAQTILAPQTGWALLAGFSLLWISLGYFWGRKAKSLAGHMLAGRNVGLALGSATAVATWVTSNTTMLAPQFALQMGVWGMLAYASASVGLFLFAPLADRIARLMPNGFTSAEFFRLRFGKGAWLVFMAISLFYAFTWLISMGIAGGLLLEALSGIPYARGMTVLLLVCTAYTVFGGLKAVIGTDFIQSFLILCGVVIVGVALLQHVPVRTLHAHVTADRPMLLRVFLPVALMSVFNNLLFGIGEIFHSNVWWSRAFAFRPGVAKKAYMIGGLVWLPIPVAAGFIALAAPALHINIPQVNMVGPLVTANVLGPAGAIVVFVIVFSSIASSIDSLLAATSDLITKEVIGETLRPHATDQELRRLTPFVIAGLALLTWAVCLMENRDLATVLFRAGPLVGSAIWPVIAGLYWQRANSRGVAVAMLMGSACGLWAYYNIGWYSAALVGTAVSMLITIVSTALFPTHFVWERLRG